jgi:hypothetical protein
LEIYPNQSSPTDFAEEPKKFRIHVGVRHPISVLREKSEKLLFTGLCGLAPSDPQSGELIGVLVQPLAHSLQGSVHTFLLKPLVSAFRGFLRLVQLYDQFCMWIQFAHEVTIVNFLVFINKLPALLYFLNKYWFGIST